MSDLPPSVRLHSFLQDAPNGQGVLRFGESAFPETARRHRAGDRWWLHGLLFAVTCITTTIFGYALVQSFAAGHQLDAEQLVQGYWLAAHGSPSVLTGLEFSLPLMLILLAHEFGHYLACVRWRVDASLPYFLPSPTLFGTLGAFIRIRSPIYRRNALFDIGVSGPIAGFVVLAPFLGIGMHLSRAVHAMPVHGDFAFGTPVILRIAELLRFPGTPSGAIVLHPMAMAAWAGLLATAVNLLPVGQLDGGHILYAALGPRWHRVLSSLFVVVLVAFGFLYWVWWIWATLMFFFGRRHPLTYDTTPLHRRRLILAAASLLLFAGCISLVPVYMN